MIIDFHTHIYPDKIAAKGVAYVGDFYGFSLDTSFGTLENLNAQCRDAGVDYKVLLAVAVRADQVVSINNWLSVVLDGHTFGFGCLHPDFTNPVAELKRFRTLGFKGLKLHPDMQRFNADAPQMFPVYDWLEQNRFILYLHAGDSRFDYSHPRRIAAILDRFPALTVIAAHFGGYQRWEESKQLLCGRKVYFDTSSSLPFISAESAVEMIRRHGADKILFGTDYPVISQSRELELFRRLQLDEHSRRAILFENGKKLLGF